jgi:hypothetical protein
MQLSWSGLVTLYYKFSMMAVFLRSAKPKVNIYIYIFANKYSYPKQDSSPRSHNSSDSSLRHVHNRHTLLSCYFTSKWLCPSYSMTA